MYGAANLHSYHDRIRCAAGRCFQRYPTVAVMRLSEAEFADEFFAVGTVDETYAIVIVDPHSADAYKARYRAI